MAGSRPRARRGTIKKRTQEGAKTAPQFKFKIISDEIPEGVNLIATNIICNKHINTVHTAHRTKKGEPRSVSV